MDKIFITKLELLHFQKHTHLILEFVNGVNIIHGETDAGKSCVVRAIKWIFFNEPKGDCIRKEGTKQTSVKVWLSNGNIVERLKSDTVNAYIINEDNKNRYDSIGKQIPTEVRKVLGINPLEVDGEEIILNVANQISLPFLMDKSGTFRNKLFNKLTGADLLDNAMQGLNSDLLHINKEEKSENISLIQKTNEFKELFIERETKNELYKKLLMSFNLVKTKQNNILKLIEFKEKINKIEEDININQKKMESIKFVDENKLDTLDYTINKLEILNELLYNIKQNKTGLLEVEELNNKIKIPNIDINSIRNKIEQLTRLQKTIKDLNNIDKLSEAYIEELEQRNVQIVEDKIKYAQLLKECKICPTCGKSTEEI